MGNKVCQTCGDELVTDNFDRCRNCIVQENKEVVNKITENFNEEELRELNIIYTEAKNRILREEN